jgi:hypothetical protein
MVFLRFIKNEDIYCDFDENLCPNVPGRLDANYCLINMMFISLLSFDYIVKYVFNDHAFDHTLRKCDVQSISMGSTTVLPHVKTIYCNLHCCDILHSKGNFETCIIHFFSIGFTGS